MGEGRESVREMGEGRESVREMGEASVSTAVVSNIPQRMSASEVLQFLESELGSNSVDAVEISSEHKQWKSRGAGRVQFSTPGALARALESGLELEAQRLALAPAPHDMFPRASAPIPCTLHASVVENPRRVWSLWSWPCSSLSLLPSSILLCPPLPFVLRLPLNDVVSSLWCPSSKSLLLRFKYAPAIYHSPAPSQPDRFHAFNRLPQPLTNSARALDFSPNHSIGFSDSFLLRFPPSVTPDFSSLPFFSRSDSPLDLQPGSHLLSPTHLAPLVSPFPELPQSLLFKINSLIHFHKISLAAVTPQLLHRLTTLQPDRSSYALSQLQISPTTCYDPLTFIDTLGSNPTPRLNPPTAMMCHRAIITPTKIYLMGPEIETSNFVVAHFAAHAEDFIRVTFVDENWSKLPPDALSYSTREGALYKTRKTQIHDRILSILRNGIVVGSNKYEFLAFSASQLRSRSLWMFASNEKVRAEDIRRWMGCFTSIRSVSKCAARMGQLFSSSRQTVHVKERDVEHLPDVECTRDGVTYCFSDGVGKISRVFAQQVAGQCGLARVPSVFQIRYGGYKGVVAVDRNSFRKLSLRPSMLKFSSENRMLNVTSWSKPMPCYLNREIVTLLTTLGVEDRVFETLLNDQLELMSRMGDDAKAAIVVLKNLVGSNDGEMLVKMMNHGYEPRSEPYLSMMLSSCYETLYADLRGKCKVFVPKGRVLMGCLDEVGNLEYGQVFVKITKRSGAGTEDETETETLRGKVAVTRNPCLHPGDIRVLEAVYDAVLDEKGLVDCVVFPQKGPRPHPNECSGGDLDGDLFFLTWDDGLIPRENDAPMDYLGGRPRIMDHEVTTDEIQKFFVEYMINDTLGLISSAHLVHADREGAKARSENCLQLAALHSVAVDFAKSGAPAEMPRFLIPRQYPDFMERFEKPAYESQGILGKLYRTTVAAEKLDLKERGIEDGAYDADLEEEGFEKMIEIARGHREMYSERMSGLMNYYGARGEVEILTGNLRNREMYMQRDSRVYIDVRDRIAVGVKCLRREAKEWFDNGWAPQDRGRLASAWYHVVYHPLFRHENAHCLSFPWIAGDTLLSIKSSKL